MSKILFIMLGCIICAGGCSQNKQIISAPDFNARTVTVKNVGVVMAGAAVYELNVASPNELNVDWSSQAATNLAKVSVAQLSAVGFNARLLQLDDQTKSVALTFNDIPREQLSRYVYSGRKLEGPNPDKVNDFMSKEGLDAIVFVRAVDHVSSGGRQAARVAAAVLLGKGVSSGVAHVELALLDKTPAIVYYSHKLEDGKDLRNEEDMGHMFSEIMDEYKELKGKN